MQSDMLKAGGSVAIRSDRARTYDKLIQSNPKKKKKKKKKKRIKRKKRQGEGR